MILPQEIIRRKRDGDTLSKDELMYMANGIADGSISEGQAAAFAMAVYFQGMDTKESANWTHAMRDSGDVIQWPRDRFDGPILDKHSSGGVGDKVSLILAPMLAACGATVPMISGRGLGHTGGTLDKLESIPGFRTNLTRQEFESTLEKAGCAIVGASSSIAPADRKLYAVRDLTATVDSIPLITASILSKKMAAGLDGLVLDIKTGSGAFASTMEMAQELAKSLVDVGNASGLPTRALITDMNQVLGRSAGNNLEVIEALDYLTTGKCDDRLEQITLALGCEILQMGKLAATQSEAKKMLQQSIANGKAAERFAKMAYAQGASKQLLYNYKELLSPANIIHPILSPKSGVVESVDTRRIGLAIIALGGGRTSPDDSIQPAVGFTNVAGLGEAIEENKPFAIVHADTESDAELATRELTRAFCIGETAPEPHLLYDRI